MERKDTLKLNVVDKTMSRKGVAKIKISPGIEKFRVIFDKTKEGKNKIDQKSTELGKNIEKQEEIQKIGVNRIRNAFEVLLNSGSENQKIVGETRTKPKKVVKSVKTSKSDSKSNNRRKVRSNRTVNIPQNSNGQEQNEGKSYQSVRDIFEDIPKEQSSGPKNEATKLEAPSQTPKTQQENIFKLKSEEISRKFRTGEEIKEMRTKIK